MELAAWPGELKEEVSLGSENSIQCKLPQFSRLPRLPQFPCCTLYPASPHPPLGLLTLFPVPEGLVHGQLLRVCGLTLPPPPGGPP